MGGEIFPLPMPKLLTGMSKLPVVATLSFILRMRSTICGP